MRFDADPCPFLMNQVGENRVLLALLDVVLGPIVGQLVAGFLAGHALLDPFVAASVFLPCFPGPVER